MAIVGTGQTFATYFAFAVDAICKVLWREGYHRGPQDLVRETGNRIRRLEILPGLRHSILVEAPGVVAGLVRDFLV